MCSAVTVPAVPPRTANCPITVIRRGLQGRDKVVQNRIDHRFVENPFIPIREEIELQTLHFDARLVWNVPNRDRRKVRLTRDRADARELRKHEFDLIIALGPRIRERFEDRRRLGDLTFGQDRLAARVGETGLGILVFDF